MSKYLCIYHANCADGLGAAWAVHRALGDGVEFLSAKYGELPPIESYDGEDGRRHFSLRSPEGGADVGAVARRMAEQFNAQYQSGTWAGGGHEHAAGFDAPIGWEGE